MNKKIIGYKAPYDLFGGNVKKGTEYKATSSNPTPLPKYTPIYNGKATGFQYDLPKEIVETWEPIYETEPLGIKKGDILYCLDGFSFTSDDDIVRIENITEEKNWWIDVCDLNGKHTDGFRWSAYKENFRLATESEIEEVLIREANRRGFKEGVEYKSAHDNNTIGVGKGNLFYSKSVGGALLWTFGDGCIYTQGKWAEIIFSCPQIEVNGYKGEFFDEYVKFGCAGIDKDLFIDLNDLGGGIGNRAIESVTIGKGIFTKDQIEEIAEYYEKITVNKRK